MEKLEEEKKIENEKKPNADVEADTKPRGCCQKVIDCEYLNDCRK